MSCLKASLLVLALVGLASAQGVRIAGETKVEPYKLVRLGADGVGPKAGVIWRVSPSKGVDKASSSGKTKLEFVAPPGVYTVDVLAVQLSPDGTTLVDEASVTVTIGTPEPPKPPDPPLPPAPQGLRVLMVYETSQSMPQAQANVLFSQQVRDYLQAKCVVGDDKKTREWRIWDKDTDVSLESKFWQDALGRARSSTPWIQVYAGGKLAYEGALPADIPATLEVLKRFGGA